MASTSTGAPEDLDLGGPEAERMASKTHLLQVVFTMCRALF